MVKLAFHPWRLSHRDQSLERWWEKASRWSKCTKVQTQRWDLEERGVASMADSRT